MHFRQGSGPAAILSLVLSFTLIASCPALAATITDDLTVSGNGNTGNRTVSGDDVLTGNTLAQDYGEVDMRVSGSAQVTGTIIGDRDGLVYLDASDNAVLSGTLDMGNGADAEVTLSGNALYSGDMAVENSGGYLHMSISDQAEVSGNIRSGSWSSSRITLQDSGAVTGGLHSEDGGDLVVFAGDDARIEGGIFATGNGNIAISAGDNTAIAGDLDVEGNGQATLDLNGNTSFTGDMTANGSGRFILGGQGNVKVTGDLETSGGGSANVTLRGTSGFSGDVTTNPGGSTAITLYDSSTLAGDTFTGAGTTFTLDLWNTARFTGSSAIEWGTANITLHDSGTAWYVTQPGRTSAANGASGSPTANAVSNLSLAEGSWVYLGAQNYNVQSSADRVQLDILTLSGNGNFEMRPYVEGIGTDAQNTGDLVYVTNTGGSHNIYVPSKELQLGGVAVDGNERLMVVRSMDGNGAFNLYQNKQVDIGHLSYDLIQYENNWYLVAGTPVPDPDPGTDGNGGDNGSGGDGGNNGGNGGDNGSGGDGGNNGGNGGDNGSGGDGGNNGGNGGDNGSGGDGGNNGGNGGDNGSGGDGGNNGGNNGGNGGGNGSGGDGGNNGGNGGDNGSGGDGGNNGGNGGDNGSGGDGGNNGGNGGDNGSGGDDGNNGGNGGDNGSGGDGGNNGGNGGDNGSGGDGGNNGGNGGDNGSGGDGGNNGGNGGDNGSGGDDGNNGGNGGDNGSDGDGGDNGSGGDGGDGAIPPGIGDLDPGFGVQATNQLNRPAEASVRFMMANYLVNYVEVQTLLQRMGDLRQSRKGDVWARGFGGRLDSFTFSHLSNFSMDYYGFQAGADTSLDGISRDLFVGVMGGYTEGDPEHSYGDSKVKSYHGGLYLLYGTEDDWYVDVIGKFSRIHDKFTVEDSQGNDVSGSSMSNAYTAGIETGKRFYFKPEREGIYVEPQGQVTYTHQDKVKFHADNGLKTKVRDYDSVLLRGSSLLGYQSKNSKVPFDVYLKAGYVREVSAKVDVHYNDRFHHSYDFKGGWGDFGVGVTAELGKAHNLYLDAGLQTGDRFNNRKINFGYRFTF